MAKATMTKTSKSFTDTMTFSAPTPERALAEAQRIVPTDSWTETDGVYETESWGIHYCIEIDADVPHVERPHLSDSNHRSDFLPESLLDAEDARGHDNRNMPDVP